MTVVPSSWFSVCTVYSISARSRHYANETMYCRLWRPDSYLAREIASVKNLLIIIEWISIKRVLLRGNFCLFMEEKGRKSNEKESKRQKGRRRRNYVTRWIEFRCLQWCLLCIYCVMLEIFVTARSHVGRYTRSVRSKIPDYIDVVIHDGARQLLPLVTSPGVPGLFRISRYARGYRAYIFSSLDFSLSLSLSDEDKKRTRSTLVCSFYFRCVKSGTRTRTRQRVQTSRNEE